VNYFGNLGNNIDRTFSVLPGALGSNRSRRSILAEPALSPVEGFNPPPLFSPRVAGEEEEGGGLSDLNFLNVLNDKDSSLSLHIGSLDGKIRAVAPFFPRADVVTDLWKAEQAQRDVTVGGAVSALAVWNHFFVGDDAGLVVHRL
jgi:hypothetical protein